MVRFKNRYFLFEIVWGETGRVPSGLSQQLVIRAVRDSVAAHFGDVGTGVTASTLQIKHFNDVTGTGILRASRDAHRSVWAALTLVTSLAGHPCFFRVVHLGGTIRSCQAVAIRHGLADERLALLASAEAS